jgi:hypothetical protein
MQIDKVYNHKLVLAFLDNVITLVLPNLSKRHMLDLIGSTQTPVPVRGCENLPLEIPWHRSDMVRRVVICHIANFFYGI